MAAGARVQIREDCTKLPPRPTRELGIGLGAASVERGEAAAHGDVGRRAPEQPVRLDAISLTFLVIPAIGAAVVGQLRSLGWTLFGGILIGVVEAELTNFKSLSEYKSLTELVIGAGVVLIIQRKSTISFSSADA